MATPSELHPDLAELAFLVGDWSGTGEGVWPPGEAFDYAEDVTFEYLGDPFLLYSERCGRSTTARRSTSRTGSFGLPAPASSSWCSPTRSGSPRSRLGPWTAA